MNRESILKEYFARLGRKSARARLEKLSAKERSRIASNAAKARWAKADAREKGK